jgi:1-acyl-sn-glycerol-3-phosphate acyltransferase
MGVRLSTSGIDCIPSRDAMLVFNHSSYVDSFVLTAVLPGEPAIVAKRELSTQFIAGPLLRRLEIPFVERYDVSGSLADAEAALSEFYLGAFKTAAEANIPVLPGVLRGTRSILRSDQWFPRHGAVTVEIEQPVMPSGTDFKAVVQLRDAVRKIILSRCGEPDLGELIKPSLS